MAHFAKLDENNNVLEVHVVDNGVLLDEHGNESEEKGIQFLIEWSGGYTYWKQTSYNGSFRKTYAAPGGYYDPINNAFVPPKYNPSWILNEETYRWEPPIPYPNDGNYYAWDEATVSWLLLTE
jgi:hypothetical protein